MQVIPKIMGIVASAIGTISVPALASTPVGAIYGCYACRNTGDATVDAALAANPDVASDGLLFEFTNTSASAITGGVFNLSAGTYTDSYTLPALAANTTFILIPGKMTDGGSHPSNSLFFNSGATMDTSDGNGAVNDASVFAFTGLSGVAAVTSGSFSAGDAALQMPARDNSIPDISFLGNGPNSDFPCNDCYFGKIATLSVPSPDGAVPESATWAMMLIGMGTIGWAMRRKLVAPQPVPS